jgi:hypothetical protein
MSLLSLILRITQTIITRKINESKKSVKNSILFSPIDHFMLVGPFIWYM